MRWLVIGSNGMLGQDLVGILDRRGDAVSGIDRDVVDITDPAATERAVVGYDIVVNCAAFTAVDAAEASEPVAFAVNAVGAANVARAAHLVGARVVHISTDYVFDGRADVPYGEVVAPAPRSAYGRTKLAGEWAVRAENPDHLVVRTAWLYGAHGACFPKTIARVARERGGLDVVADQFGQPTWTVDLADLIVRLVDAKAPSGLYHGTSQGETSWYEFAQAVVRSAGLDPAIVEVTSSGAFVRAAERPLYSVLAHAALLSVGVDPIGPWEQRWEVASADVLRTTVIASGA